MWPRCAGRGMVILVVVGTLLDTTTALPSVEHATPPTEQKQVRIMPETRNTQFSVGPDACDLAPRMRVSCHIQHDSKCSPLVRWLLLLPSPKTSPALANSLMQSRLRTMLIRWSNMVGVHWWQTCTRVFASPWQCMCLLLRMIRRFLIALGPAGSQEHFHPSFHLQYG